MLNPRWIVTVMFSFCSDNNTTRHVDLWFRFLSCSGYLFVFKFSYLKPTEHDRRAIRSESEFLDCTCIVFPANRRENIDLHDLYTRNTRRKCRAPRTVWECLRNVVDRYSRNSHKTHGGSVGIVVLFYQRTNAKVFSSRFGSRVHVIFPQTFGRRPPHRCTQSKTNRPLFTKLLVSRPGVVQRQTRVYGTPA